MSHPQSGYNQSSHRCPLIVSNTDKMNHKALIATPTVSQNEKSSLYAKNPVIATQYIATEGSHANRRKKGCRVAAFWISMRRFNSFVASSINSLNSPGLIHHGVTKKQTIRTNMKITIALIMPWSHHSTATHINPMINISMDATIRIKANTISWVDSSLREFKIPPSDNRYWPSHIFDFFPRVLGVLNW